MNCVQGMLHLIQLLETNYINTFSAHKTCHSHLYNILINTQFTDGCTFGTYCTVGTFIHTGVILLACSVCITLQVYHLLLLLCPLQIKAISKMVGISVAQQSFSTSCILKQHNFKCSIISYVTILPDILHFLVVQSSPSQCLCWCSLLSCWLASLEQHLPWHPERGGEMLHYNWKDAASMAQPSQFHQQALYGIKNILSINHVLIFKHRETMAR